MSFLIKHIVDPKQVVGHLSIDIDAIPKCMKLSDWLYAKEAGTIWLEDQHGVFWVDVAVIA